MTFPLGDNPLEHGEPQQMKKRMRVKDGAMVVPAGYATIQDVIARASLDPVIAAGLAAARKDLALEIDQGAHTFRSLRLSRGLSQSELAEQIGTSQSHIARIERGTENLALSTLRKLTAALQVDMNQLDAALLAQEQVNTRDLKKS